MPRSSTRRDLAITVTVCASLEVSPPRRVKRPAKKQQSRNAQPHGQSSNDASQVTGVVTYCCLTCEHSACAPLGTRLICRDCRRPMVAVISL